MRLVFAAKKSFGVWQLTEVNKAAEVAESEEGCRLAYVAASRAEDRLILSGFYKDSDREPLEELKPGDSVLRRLLPTLAELGWEGGGGLVMLPGARPIGTSERLGEVPLEIRTSEPSAERAAELIRRFDPPAEPAPIAGTVAPPPLLGERPSPVPIGHLSYSALALYERCGYRFYVERVLGAREGLATAPGETDEDARDERVDDELAEPDIPRDLALGIGNSVHAALEWSAEHAWAEPPDDLFERLLSREGLAGDADSARRVRELVDAWLGSPLREELGEDAVQAEVPFLLGLGPTVIRGQIDLLVAGSDGVPTVVDYKTDRLSGRQPQELADRYRAQREIYALAAGPDGARVAHVFLERPDDPVVEAVTADDLPAVRERLVKLVERMQGNEFEPTHEPYPALCFGCPAAARLCPRPAWRPRG
jgi:ATP-dependent helicase/nuclease subunit A